MGAVKGKAFPFSARLRHELVQREWGVRTLAREMAAKQNQPDRVESLRRQLRKYLDGTIPTAGSRHAIEEAFGLERDALKSEPDDEESRDMVAVLMPSAALRKLVREEMARA